MSRLPKEPFCTACMRVCVVVGMCFWQMDNFFPTKPKGNRAPPECVLMAVRAFGGGKPFLLIPVLIPFANFHCQLQIECSWMRESVVDWIFQGPVCAVLIINLVFLIRIMWVSRGACTLSTVRITPIHSLPFPFCLTPCRTGANHEATLSEHGRDAPVSEGIEGAPGADTAARHNVPGRTGRTCRRAHQ